VVAGVPTLVENHSFGPGVTRLVLADVNADGRQDLAVVGDTQPVLYILRNTAAPWTKLGAPLAGSAGDSLLAGEGTLLAGSPVRISVVGAVPLTNATLVAGLTAINAPFKGGVLVPKPDLLLTGLPLDASGGIELLATWPAGLPSGFSFLIQAWQADGGGPQGFSSTNGLRGEAP